MDAMKTTPVSPCAHCFATIQIGNEFNLSVDWHRVEVMHRHLRTLDSRHPLNGTLHVERVIRPHFRVANDRHAASCYRADRLTADSLTASVLRTHRSLLQGSTQRLYLRVRMQPNFVHTPITAQRIYPSDH